MLFITYQFIIGLLVVLVAIDVLRASSLARQATGALVLIPLLLRLFLVK